MKKRRVIISVTNDLVIDQRVHKVAMSLLEMGLEVLCVGVRHKHSPNLTGKPYRVSRMNMLFSKGAFFYVEYNVRLFFKLLFSSFSLLWSNDLDSLLANRLAGIIKRHPLVYDSHEYFPEIPELKDRPRVKAIWEGLEKILVPGVSLAFTVCQSIADIYRKKYGVDFKVLRNLPLASNVKGGEAVFDAKGKKVVIYQGAVNVGRGIEPVVKAFEQIEGVILLIVGSGDVWPLVNQMVVDLKLEEKVILTGKVPFEQLQAYTCMADLGLCLLENKGLNYFYSLPNRVFDYAAAGVPILASDFPEIRKVVGVYNTGMLLDGLEPNAIAMKIKEACFNEDLRGEWQSGMTRVAREFIWENEQQVVKKAIQKLFPGYW